MPVVGWRSRLLSWKHRIRPQTYSCSQQICLEGGQGENCTVQKTLKLAFVVEFTSRKFFHISHGCIKAVKVELFQFAFCSLQYGLKSYFCKYYLSNALYHGGTAGVGITTVYLSSYMSSIKCSGYFYSVFWHYHFCPNNITDYLASWYMCVTLKYTRKIGCVLSVLQENYKQSRTPFNAW